VSRAPGIGSEFRGGLEIKLIQQTGQFRGSLLISGSARIGVAAVEGHWLQTDETIVAQDRAS
jgi:hypothetical protein